MLARPLVRKWSGCVRIPRYVSRPTKYALSEWSSVIVFDEYEEVPERRIAAQQACQFALVKSCHSWLNALRSGRGDCSQDSSGCIIFSSSNTSYAAGLRLGFNYSLARSVALWNRSVQRQASSIRMPKERKSLPSAKPQ